MLSLLVGFFSFESVAKETETDQVHGGVGRAREEGMEVKAKGFHPLLDHRSGHHVHQHVVGREVWQRADIHRFELPTMSWDPLEILRGATHLGVEHLELIEPPNDIPLRSVDDHAILKDL